jgi:signal transduction histidine kinase
MKLAPLLIVIRYDHDLGVTNMSDTRSQPLLPDVEPISRWERWPIHWIGAAIGAAGGAIDVLLLFAFGVKMKLGGVDATFGVLMLLTTTYAGMGYVIGRLKQEEARSKRDNAIIARQFRELELAQRELVQQEKLAAIGRVAAGVAHEVRNPLGVIRASASMVQESFEPSEDPFRACEFICEEIDRLNALITALLTFSRPTELNRKTIALPTAVDHAITLATEDLRRRHIELQRDDAANLPELSADPDLVSQVVYGLISNAAEALGEGGCIAVRTGSERGTVHVEVADSGAGVRPEAVAHVFEPFFTTKATGTGLGLPMAERIAHAHGGSLCIVAGHGSGAASTGACFRLELPIEAAKPHPDVVGAAVNALESARSQALA